MVHMNSICLTQVHGVTSKNINELDDADICYGKMIVTVGSNRDECEFYFDLDKVAQKSWL